MNRSTAGKIKCTKRSEPAVRIPCPICDEVVHERRPEQNYDDERCDRSSLGNCAKKYCRSYTRKQTNVLFLYKNKKITILHVIFDLKVFFRRAKRQRKYA